MPIVSAPEGAGPGVGAGAGTGAGAGAGAGVVAGADVEPVAAALAGAGVEGVKGVAGLVVGSRGSASDDFADTLLTFSNENRLLRFSVTVTCLLAYQASLNGIDSPSGSGIVRATQFAASAAATDFMAVSFN